jgi:hypothetical protein
VRPTASPNDGPARTWSGLLASPKVLRSGWCFEPTEDTELGDIALRPRPEVRTVRILAMDTGTCLLDGDGPAIKRNGNDCPRERSFVKYRPPTARFRVGRGLHPLQDAIETQKQCFTGLAGGRAIFRSDLPMIRDEEDLPAAFNLSQFAARRAHRANDT